ncbi:MAG TPA: alpha/beta hydrolase [Flavobacterium sp.]|nr:alpha/beta hydrolase [Flavobacterium sp.]
MKKCLIFTLFGIMGCSSDDSSGSSPLLEASTLLNVSYGSDPQQLIDIYLPAGRSAESTKVLFLVHGGGWTGGSKADLTPAVAGLKAQFPDCAIVNIGYRLGTVNMPAFPNQINDIKLAVSHMQGNNYAVSKQYAFFGVSAGAHLSLLYAYKFDPERHVKAVCSIVGPTDFTDPAYSLYTAVASPYLVGLNPPPDVFQNASPVTHVTAQSARTIQFAGTQDQLVPLSQSQRLKAKLDESGVQNELHVYNAGHGNFSPVDSQDINAKILAFLNASF